MGDSVGLPSSKLVWLCCNVVVYTTTTTQHTTALSLVDDGAAGSGRLLGLKRWREWCERESDGEVWKERGRWRDRCRRRSIRGGWVSGRGRDVTFINVRRYSPG